eukprot:TRINITY_DN2732_c0_g1_i1.p1 TRINITY_DN2732_c0_g1~~TRINITY_DN2732_c0_g1_i1.p1  ORF type:complete len:380 (+),score=64.35 TRINITY_DN2732_c0_g1_i1:118-1257(+)
MSESQDDDPDKRVPNLDSHTKGLKEPAIQSLDSDNKFIGQDTQNLKKMFLKNKKIRDHHEKELINEMRHSILNQLEEELKIMGEILAHTQKRKSKAQKFLCRLMPFPEANSFEKLRYIIKIQGPLTLREEISKAIDDSQSAISSNIAHSIIPFVHKPKEMSPEGKEDGKEREAECSVYEKAVNEFINKRNEDGGSNAVEKEDVLHNLLHEDLTGYGGSKGNTIFFISCQYDMKVPSSIMIFSSRYCFARSEDRVVQFISRKRKAHQKQSLENFTKYKKQHIDYTIANKKFEAHAQTEAQRKNDFFPREAHFLCSPKIPILAPKVGEASESSMNYEVTRRESFDLDPEQQIRQRSYRETLKTICQRLLRQHAFPAQSEAN